MLPRGITSGSTSPAQSGSISVLCVRLQSTRRSNIYSNTCVVCKLVVRVRVYGPVAHMHKRRVLHICISLENRARSCAFVCVRCISETHDLYSFSSIEIVSRLRFRSFRRVIIPYEILYAREIFLNDARYLECYRKMIGKD